MPRPRSKLKFFDWVQHLMRYRDGRFAQHERFRYAVFNLWIREQSSGRSRWLINKGSHARSNFTTEELRQYLSDPAADRHPLLNGIIRCASTIKGTRPFWKRYSRQLGAYIQCLGRPAIFFTFSAADTQWDSLARHMPQYVEWKTADDELRYILEFLLNVPSPL